VYKFRRVSALAAATIAAVAFSNGLHAGTLYFDNNGATVGAVAAANLTTQQTWNTASTNWNATADGTGTPAAWIDGSDAVFSAGITGSSANLATGTYNVTTAGAKIANSITVKDGTVTFLPSATPPTRTIGAGGVTLASTAGGVVFSEANGGDTLILSGSQSWTNNSASSAFTVNNPIHGNAATGTFLLTAAPNGSANMIFGGGTVPAFSGTLVTGEAVPGSAIGITDGTSGGNLAFLAAGTGTVSLQGADTYTGGTTVSSGEILLDNGGSLAHSNITITGGTFAGGTTGAGGAITDNINNDVAELISVSGTGVLDLTNLHFNLSLTGTQTQAEYVLANADVGSPNVTGTQFAGVNLPAGWSISYTGTTANPNDIVLVNSNLAAPEPASLSVLGLGTLCLIRRRRR
jgi:fibronectin-binding autotransporter adhesin